MNKLNSKSWKVNPSYEQWLKKFNPKPTEKELEEMEKDSIPANNSNYTPPLLGA